MTIQIKVFWRKEHILTFNAQSQSGKFKLGSPKHVHEQLIEQLPTNWLADLRKIINGHIREFYKDPRYCSFFDETGMIESQIKSL